MKDWKNGLMPAPAAWTSRMTMSRATRMFCCLSVSAGSRRKAFCPPVSSPKTAPVTIRVTVMATSSSMRLNPESWRDCMAAPLLTLSVMGWGTRGRSTCTCGTS